MARILANSASFSLYRLDCAEALSNSNSKAMRVISLFIVIIICLHGGDAVPLTCQLQS